MKLSWWHLIAGGLLGLLAYSLFSFSLTAPNLVLSNLGAYWQFQVFMWETFFNNPPLLAQVFLAIICWLVLTYGLSLITLADWLGVEAGKKRAQLREIILLVVAVTIGLASLVLSSPALSYDVFNYIFNAKMVLYYQADPHVMTALDFAHDDWLRFMHNTHTSAPYGQGWTTLSLLPYWLGDGKFTLTLYLFKVFSLLSLIGLAAIFYWANRAQEGRVSKNSQWLILAVLINPLLLIEVVGNTHNDLFMMIPAMIGMLILALRLKKLTLGQTSKMRFSNTSLVIFSGLAMIASISIKLATVTLTPIWLLLVMLIALHRVPEFVIRLLRSARTFDEFRQWLSHLTLSLWPLLASLAMFIPLLTERSKWFLPWYLIWSLVWIGLLNSTKSAKNIKFSYPSLQSSFNRLDLYGAHFTTVWISFLLALSCSSLLRYFPILSAGEYSNQIIFQSRLVTWLGAVILTPIWYALVSKSFKKFRS